MINPQGLATTYYVQFGQNTSYGRQAPATPAPVGSDSSFHRVSQTISGLDYLTSHHWRFVAKNSSGTTYGSDRVFKTVVTVAIASPAVSTGDATNITLTSATLNGTVNPDGGQTTYHFEYGKTTSYGSDAPAFPPGASAGSDHKTHAESQRVSGLEPDTVYHFRIDAANSNGMTEGADHKFTTTPLAPVVQTGTATGVTTSAAMLTGTVNPRGTATTYHFDWGPTSSYGHTVPMPDASAGSDATAHSEQQHISGLSAHKTYHFRIVATSKGGTANGNDQTVTTKSVPVKPPVTPKLSRLSISPRRPHTAGRRAHGQCVAPTRANRHHRACTRPLVLHIGYRLNERATVTFVVQRLVHHHYVTLRGTFTHRSQAGATKFVWHGRVHGHRLGLGSYRLIATPKTSGGTGKRQTVTFAIRR